MTNTNCLEGVKCPACGNEDTFRIQITTMADVTDDGAEVEHGEMDWDEASYAECAQCCKHGKLSDFKLPDETPPAAPVLPTLLEALEQAVAALNTAPRFRVPSLGTDSYAIAALIDRAIAGQKEGAP
jgi:hypothetical protein